MPSRIKKISHSLTKKKKSIVFVLKCYCALSSKVRFSPPFISEAPSWPSLCLGRFSPSVSVILVTVVYIIVISVHAA